MDIKILFTILLSTILINNYVLSRILGICPFMAISKRLGSALGMGSAIIFLMTLSSFITYPIYKYLLVEYDMTYLTIIVFILVIAALTQLVEMIIRKISPVLYQALGIFPPFITTNCAVLGVALLNISSGFFDPKVSLGLLKSTLQGFGGGVGFTLALLIMTGIRERLELADIPENLKGVPITFLTAGLLALAFYGFSGMKI